LVLDPDLKWLSRNVADTVVGMKAATWKDIAEHVLRLAMAIPTTLGMVSYSPLVIGILRLQRYPMNLKE